MTNVEGVIKFQCDFTVGSALTTDQIAALNHWRRCLFRRQLIGQDPERYGGYGYGNVSCTLLELAGDSEASRPAITIDRSFLITGTQTGHLPVLGPDHYVRVTEYAPSQNRIAASGPTRPSSESLTHGAVYASEPYCNAVLHVHSPLLWHSARELAMPITDPTVPCGTPAMASEVKRLLGATAMGSLGIFAMGGHEDGIIAYGPTLDKAGNHLLEMLTTAIRAAIP